MNPVLCLLLCAMLLLTYYYRVALTQTGLRAARPAGERTAGMGAVGLLLCVCVSVASVCFLRLRDADDATCDPWPCIARRQGQLVASLQHQHHRRQPQQQQHEAS